MSNNSPHIERDTTRLIFLERSGDWANRWRRRYPTEDQWIVEARSFPQLAEALTEYSTSLVLVEMTADNGQRTTSFVEELHRRFPRCASAVALGSAKLLPASVPRLLRELGVNLVVESPREIETLAAWWRRQSERFPPHAATIREQIFQRLPLAG